MRKKIKSGIDTNLMKTLAENLRVVLKEQNIDKHWIAQALDCSESALNGYLSGTHPISTIIFIKICSMAKVTDYNLILPPTPKVTIQKEEKVIITGITFGGNDN